MLRTTRQATNDNMIRRMRCVCWITKAADTHSEYVIFIAFTLQVDSLEVSVLLYMYIFFLLKDSNIVSYLTASKYPSTHKNIFLLGNHQSLILYTIHVALY
jgi:hypothetical protein